MRKMQKAASVQADSVILDLEDAVLFGQKTKARHLVVEALAAIDFGRRERLVRVNPEGTDFFTEDMMALLASNIDGIVIPKVESEHQILRADQIISDRELEHEGQSGSIRLFALIETALGVMNVKEISQSSPRLDGLIFGGEDFVADVGAARSEQGLEILHARSAVVTAASAYGLEAVDTVYLDLNNIVGLERDCLFARQLGFSGKLAIHPGQLETINKVFSPAEEEIAQAERLLKAYHSFAAAGTGVFTLDGRMVDMPQVVAAERLLEKAGSLD